MAIPPPADGSAVRVGDSPIITPGMLPGRHGENINGPSVIAMPAWATARLGRFHMYFAHHRGERIRLAHADHPEGPWTVHPAGSLAIADLPGGHDHVASPDVHVDDAARRIIMYVHAPAASGGDGGAFGSQVTFAAESEDGLRFIARPGALAPFYLRAFRHAGAWFAFAKGGDLYRSPDGRTRFALVGNPFTDQIDDRPHFNRSGDIRHLAVDLRDGRLTAYFSRIGDRPERLLRRSIALGPDPAAWRAGAEEEVLRPERPWEGAGLPLAASRAGAATGPEHALRDPAVLRLGDEAWLYYSIAGEQGLAVARLR